MKAFTYFNFLIITLTLVSCDPGGMSFLRNNSADTLRLKLVGDFRVDTSSNRNLHCISYYKNLYFKEEIIPDKKLDDWYGIMEEREFQIIGDSLLEISINPYSTIISNSGIVSSRLFKPCACNYVIFVLGSESDTLWNIENYTQNEIQDFYSRNEMKLTTKSKRMSTMNITDVYKLK